MAKLLPQDLAETGLKLLRPQDFPRGSALRMLSVVTILNALYWVARATGSGFFANLAHLRLHDPRLLVRILLVLVTALLVRLLFTIRLERIVTEPVRALRLVVRTISQDRNYAIRAEHHAGGEIGRLIGAFNEMLDQIERHDSARREAEHRLRLSEERYELAARGSRDGLWDHDVATAKTYESPRLNAMLGKPEVETWVTRQEWIERLHPDDRERVRAEINGFLASDRTTHEMEYRARHADGGYRWMLSRGIVVRDAAGRPVRIAGSERDITARKTTDLLTGLANRLAFLDQLAPHLTAGGSLPSVLFVDIDHFRLIDESLGRAASDEVLVQLSGRLRTLARWSERDGQSGGLTVARVGDDEFALLLAGAPEALPATQLAQRILDLLREPFFIEGQRLSVSASIGIAQGAGGESPIEMLQNAESAAHEAAARGRGRFAVFHREMRRRAGVRLDVHQGLRRAIDAGELRLHYQPVVSLSEQRIVGFEALVRWEHPERGLMGPAEFIPLAEETEVILDVGRWVLREACCQMAVWQQNFAPCPPLSIAVNLSARQMTDPRLVEQVRDTLALTGLAPERLLLEITESSVMANSSAALSVLRALRRMQVSLVIDDFGTGYSSLSYLQRLPFGTLKIDRSFVGGLDADGGTPEIVRAILALARSLNMRVVAEGVEHRGQVKRLQALGCDLLQGYYFSQPATVEETTESIRRGLSVAGALAFLSQPDPSHDSSGAKALQVLPALALSQSAAAGFD